MRCASSRGSNPGRRPVWAGMVTHGPALHRHWSGLRTSSTPALDHRCCSHRRLPCGVTTAVASRREVPFPAPRPSGRCACTRPPVEGAIPPWLVYGRCVSRATWVLPGTSSRGVRGSRRAEASQPGHHRQGREPLARAVLWTPPTAGMPSLADQVGGRSFPGPDGPHVEPRRSPIAVPLRVPRDSNPGVAAALPQWMVAADFHRCVFSISPRTFTAAWLSLLPSSGLFTGAVIFDHPLCSCPC